MFSLRNQQRSRRFRAAKEREALLADHVAREGSLPTESSFDSNCITPGTEFMFRLSVAFRRWIAYKMETDEFWRTGAEVVFSGPDVPGEGEHKVRGAGAGALSVLPIRLAELPV